MRDSKWSNKLEGSRQALRDQSKAAAKWKKRHYASDVREERFLKEQLKPEIVKLAADAFVEGMSEARPMMTLPQSFWEWG